MKRRPNKSKPGRKPESKNTPGQDPGLRCPPVMPLTPRRKWLFRFAALGVMPLLLLGGPSDSIPIYTAPQKVDLIPRDTCRPKKHGTVYKTVYKK